MNIIRSIKSIIDHIKKGYESKKTLVSITYTYLDGEPIDSIWVQSRTVVVTLYDLNGDLSRNNIRRYILHACYIGLDLMEFDYHVVKQG